MLRLRLVLVYIARHFSKAVVSVILLPVIYESSLSFMFYTLREPSRKELASLHESRQPMHARTRIMLDSNDKQKIFAGHHVQRANFQKRREVGLWKRPTTQWASEHRPFTQFREMILNTSHRRKI